MTNTQTLFAFGGKCLVSLGLLAGISVAFSLDEKDLIPEGIAYDPQTRQFFLSSINKEKEVSIIDKGNPLFNVPTTSVIVDDNLFYLANTCLEIFTQNQMNYKDKLQSPTVLKYALSD